MNHWSIPRFMIDIEALGGKPDGAIATIGMALFDFAKAGPKHSYYQRVDIQSCLDIGLKIDLGTCLWWMKQADIARVEIYRDEDRVNIELALVAMSKFIRMFSVSDDFEVWSRGPDYDLTILETAFESCGLDCPWPFRSKRDLRSVLAVSGAEIANAQTPGRHTALGGCLTQIIDIQRAVRPELFGDI